MLTRVYTHDGIFCLPNSIARLQSTEGYERKDLPKMPFSVTEPGTTYSNYIVIPMWSKALPPSLHPCHFFRGILVCLYLFTFICFSHWNSTMLEHYHVKPGTYSINAFCWTARLREHKHANTSCWVVLEDKHQHIHTSICGKSSK